MTPSRERYLAAGGDAAKLGLYESIGRVAAFADDTGRALAAVHPELPAHGALGDWTGGEALRVAAEAWLRAQGCATVMGPMELCTFFPYRAVEGPFAEPPALFEPSERPERWLAAGYTKIAHYSSAAAEMDLQITSGAPSRARCEAAGYTIAPLPVGPDGRISAEVWRAGVTALHGVVLDAFDEAFRFAPIPEPALQAWYAGYREKVDPRLIWTATAPDGEPAGFLFGVPDLLAPKRGWFLVKTLAVRRSHRGFGVSWALIHAALTAARELGYSEAVYHLMWEGSPSNHFHQRGGRIVRTYGLYEKVL